MHCPHCGKDTGEAGADPDLVALAINRLITDSIQRVSALVHQSVSSVLQMQHASIQKVIEQIPDLDGSTLTTSR